MESIDHFLAVVHYFQFYLIENEKVFQVWTVVIKFELDGGICNFKCLNSERKKLGNVVGPMALVIKIPMALFS